MATMSDSNEVKQWYLSSYSPQNGASGDAATAVGRRRQEAISRFEALGFPTTRNEDWKYTDIRPLLKHRFAPGQATDVTAAEIQDFLFDDFADNVLVFVNGVHVPALSRLQKNAAGVLVQDLASALRDNPSLLGDSLYQLANQQDDAFVALNTAASRNGAVIVLPDNTELDKPLHLLFVADNRHNSFNSTPRNLILAGKNCRAQIVETCHALGAEAYFHNTVTEASIGEGSKVDYLRLQDESVNAFHICNFQANLLRDSNFSLINIDLGGKLVRNNLNIKLDDSHIEAHLIGFYMGTGSQHIDNHTLIDHAHPHCMSNELYKGILGGNARGVFNGKVFVRQDAQKTNAYQTNQAMLLSNTARVDSKPQLEIYADDVKCSHGATVGQMDDEALFYLRSRGISEARARFELQYAFASDVFGYVPVESVRDRINALVYQRFGNL